MLRKTFLAGMLAGIITKTDILDHWIKGIIKGGNTDLAGTPIIAFDLIQNAPITVFSDETCRAAVAKMTQAEIGRLLVVAPEEPRRLIGIVTRSDMLKPRARLAEEEECRERFIGLKVGRAAEGTAPRERAKKG